MKLKSLLAFAMLIAGGGSLWAQTDVTSTYITNAGFDESSDFQTGNVATGGSNQRKAVTGWTNTGGDTYTTGAAIGFGTTGQINGANLPSTNSDGTATGGALCLNAAWQSQVWYAQEVTLPAGNYTMTFKVNNVGQNAQFEKDPVMFSFTTTDGSSFSGNVHSYPVSTWTTQTITFALAAETTGSIKIGYKASNTGSGNTPKLVVDYVKAMYNSNYTATLQSAIDRATILNARASDDDLAAAISAAQGVLDAADNTVAYQETINTAVTTLRSAISTAAAKVVLLEGENITFMFENADFESGTPVTGGITTYDYDAATNGTSFSRMQVVEGWTIVANGNAKSAGVYQFNSGAWLGSTGANYQVPASGSAGGEEKALGIVAVWSSSAQYKQACTLPAGSYIIEVPVYNTAGTTAFSKNLIGFVENGGTEHLATAKTYATGSWITEKIIFELANETAGYLSLGYTAANAGSGGMPHLFIDGVKVTYTSPIAAAYQRYQDALEAANTAITNGAYTNVTGSERTALQSAIDATPATTKEGYNDAADDLDAAREAFTGAKANYDALVAVNAMITAAGTLEYADAEKKPSASVTATSASDASAKVTSQTTALRAYYESNAKAEGVVGAVDYSSAVAAANSDTNTGWTNGVGTNSGQGYTDSDGNVSPNYLDGGWAASAPCNIDMTRDVVIPAGRYILTVKARGAQDLTVYTLSIAGETLDLPHSNGGSNGVFGNGWEDATIEFDADGTAQTLEVIAQSTANQQWFSMNDFRLVCLEINYGAYADNDDYDDLNDAISDAEAKTIGFEKDEYAPYNNEEAINALAAAKAIDQDAVLTNLKKDVQAATTALNEAVWTINESKANIIYNGMFATVAEGQNYPDGWTRTNAWGQMQSGIEGDYPTAYYNQPGSLVYGNNGLYTLPLRSYPSYTAYVVRVTYRSHENNSNKGITISVQNQDTGEYPLPAETFSANGSTSEWKTVEASFLVYKEKPGNHILTIANDGNTWITNVEMRSFYNPDDGLSSIYPAVFYDDLGLGGEYIEGRYPEAEINRTFADDATGTWYSFVAPFEITIDELEENFAPAKYKGNVVQVAEYAGDVDDGNGNVTVTFNTMDTGTIPANTPVLIYFKKKSAKYDNIDVLEFNSPKHTYIVDEAKVEGTYFDFVGVYDFADYDVADDEDFVPFTIPAGDYFIGNGALYKSAGATTINPFRAYLRAKDAPASVKLFIDDVETSIEEIQGLELKAQNSEIYNLAGQKMSKLQKGVNIVNGKKVLVK